MRFSAAALTLSGIALGCAAAGPPTPTSPTARAVHSESPPPARSLPDLAATAHGESPTAPAASSQVAPRQVDVPGWLGVALQAPGDDRPGVLISRVLRGSPAATSGLQAGDVVLSIDDTAVAEPAALSQLVAAAGAGERVSLAVMRAGQPRLIGVELRDNPGYEGQLRLGFVGARAPELVGLSVAQGGIQPSLGSLEGRVVVIEFWAPWCVACRALMPTLNHWHRQYRAEGATVLSITMDSQEQASKDAFELGMEYPVLSDPEGSAVRSYQAFALPTLFVIDRQGVVRDVAVGYDGNRLAELRRTIEALLAES